LIAALVVLVKVPEIVEALDPAAVPLIPVTLGADQLYVVAVGTIPLIEFAGVTENPVPLQTAEVMAVTAGCGLTVTVTVKVGPTQEPAVGVTVYATLMAAFVVLVKVPEIVEAPDAATVPVMPVTLGANQEYVVPEGTIPLVELTGDTVNPVALQTVEIIAVTAGLGYTVTVTI